MSDLPDLHLLTRLVPDEPAGHCAAAVRMPPDGWLRPCRGGLCWAVGWRVSVAAKSTAAVS
ncbi:hypothetical protein [Saccharopolyspora phatthalungensis]|uniref:Uncharacterized protein n=1 Tax=Saccharopolyspora phatthalungensis TaxID=664693 RepID=A0A840QK09_9PSEU|nr:hypothetical protein [Saccharopolyspora phatthalungensis]MBB5158473.1 hypothetical protein [Saccharopolyspora phatthalungensis]